MKAKRHFAAPIFASLAVLLASAAGQQPKPAVAPGEPDPTAGGTEHKDTKITSYLIGADIGGNLKRGEIELDTERFVAGLKAALAGDKLEFSEEDKARILRAFSQERQAIAQRKQQELAEANKKAGETFLAENAKKEGIKDTESGLQYKVITQGDGPIPKSTDRVKAKYRGTLSDGTVFDESKDGATFSVRGVIRGWTEALQMMPVGSKWQLYIPSDLAYGPSGRRPKIQPNSTLIFDIELVEIAKPVAATTPPVRVPPLKPAPRTPPAKPRKPITATTPPVQVEFPKEKGGKIKVTPVDPKTGKPTGETKYIEPKGEGAKVEPAKPAEGKTE